jgi:hypothetical protein
MVCGQLGRVPLTVSQPGDGQRAFSHFAVTFRTLQQAPEGWSHCTRRIQSRPSVLSTNDRRTRAAIRASFSVPKQPARTYMEASSPSDAAIARDPKPESSVPHTRVVGPPFKKAALMVRLMPVHEDSTVMPNATAGLSERYRCHPVNGDQDA